MALTGAHSAALLLLAVTTTACGSGTVPAEIPAPPVAAEPRAPAASAPESSPSGGRYDVFFGSPAGGCDQVRAAARIASGPGPATAEDAVRALLAGPTGEERGAGAESMFGTATAGALRSVRVDGATAWVDLDGGLARAIPNASTSCGQLLMLAQIDATLAPFGARQVRLAFDGDPAAYAEWAQTVCAPPCSPDGFASR